MSRAERFCLIHNGSKGSFYKQMEFLLYIQEWFESLCGCRLQIHLFFCLHPSIALPEGCLGLVQRGEAAESRGNSGTLPAEPQSCSWPGRGTTTDGSTSPEKSNAAFPASVSCTGPGPATAKRLRAAHASLPAALGHFARQSHDFDQRKH